MACYRVYFNFIIPESRKSVVKMRDFMFRGEEAEICALLGHYAASSSNFLPIFRDNPSVPFPGNLET